jgi:hypothetical protein
MEGFSARGAIAMLLTVTFAAIDWVMSLNPHWSSTAFGLTFVTDFALSALAAAGLAMTRKGSLPESGDLRWMIAKLLMTILLLDLYIFYSQYLVYWMGNVPDRVSWWYVRSVGIAKWTSLAILFCYFVLPFLLLLFGGWKETIFPAACLAIVSFRLLQVVWLVLPGREGMLPAILSGALLTPVIGFFWRGRIAQPRGASPGGRR